MENKSTTLGAKNSNAQHADGRNIYKYTYVEPQVIIHRSANRIIVAG